MDFRECENDHSSIGHRARLDFSSPEQLYWYGAAHAAPRLRFVATCSMFLLLNRNSTRKHCDGTRKHPLFGNSRDNVTGPV